MGIYRTISYKVEDLFIKMLSKKQDPALVKQKVDKYRAEQEKSRRQRKMEAAKRKEEQDRIREQKRVEQGIQQREQKAREKREIELIISKLIDNHGRTYSQYEYDEIKRNKAFFQSFTQRVLKPNEKAQSFIFCEFDKSSKKEMKGYLIPTNNRVLFVDKSLTHIVKFRYETIINLNWFKDGVVERGLHIQYGRKRLEFDEMFDVNQLKKVGNIILNNSTTRAV
jgi:hypothetical protein